MVVKMGISVINTKLSLFIKKMGNEVNKKFRFINNINFVNNTNSNFKKEESNKKSTIPMSLYIENCKNVLDGVQDKFHSIETGNPTGEYKEKVINKNISEDIIAEYVNQINNNANSIINLDGNDGDTIDAGDNLKKENVSKKEDVSKKDNRKKLPDGITNNGLKELNVNEKLCFQEKKKRSFKNLLKPLFSPFQFINRNILPIKVNYTNLNINEMIHDFKFDTEQDKNKSTTVFSKRLEMLNETFTENTNEVIKKKKNNNKSDNVIKYHTLERALECKFIKDIKILKEEFVSNVAKNKFENKFSSLPYDINRKLNDIFKSESIDINEQKKKLFSKDSIEELKKELKNKINDLDGNINIDSIIVKTFESFMSEENQEEINSESNDDFDAIKNSFSLMLTKELFNQLSKDKNFIGEEGAISKIDNLISMTSNNIYENLAKVKGDIISELKKGFYENVKGNKKEDDLLNRIFKNTSNNINYKWAQDSIILLMSYETFENKEKEINKVSNYENSGIRMLGGKGSNTKKNTMIENDLKKIFNKLGLNNDNLDESKDEVLRKYFANYFEHV